MSSAILRLNESASIFTPYNVRFRLLLRKDTTFPARYRHFRRNLRVNTRTLWRFQPDLRVNARTSGQFRLDLRVNARTSGQFRG
jgi:hypothetical protein